MGDIWILHLPPTAVTFPENDVAVLPDCFPDGLVDELEGIVEALQAGTVVINPSAEVSGQGIEVNRSRKELIGVLTNEETFGRFRDKLVGPDGKGGAIGSMLTREFGSALEALDTLDETTGPVTNQVTLDLAMKRTSSAYTVDFGVGPPQRKTLPGYAGHVLSAVQKAGLLTFFALLSSTEERRFRLPLLRAESLAGQRDHAGALVIYERLLAPGPLAPDRRKFVALRAAFAHVALGDREFRAHRDPTAAERSAVIGHYDDALAKLDAHGVSPLNPVRQHIESHIAVQRLNVEAGYNALGFKDGYVPLLRPESLRAKADTRVDLAISARDRYVEFRLRANDLEEEEARLLLERDIAELSSEIAAERREIASQQTELAETRRENIEEAQSRLALDVALSATPGVLSSMAGAYFDVTSNKEGIIGSGKGLVSAAVEYRARQNDLDNQLELARIEEEIAEREEVIAGLEEDITAVRERGIQDQLDRLESKLLGADLFYALSALYEDMAERSMTAAIRWAYLYERAVAFRRLSFVDPIIALDYRTTLAGIDTLIPAPELLLEALVLVEERDVPSDPSQFLDENPISLRTNYPIEFARFLQTGEMDFVISLYDLDKLRPGVHERRLGRVRVQVRGLIPATGFTGHITHRGFFTLRDKAATLGPPEATRLLPTPDEMRRAMARLESGKIQGDSVGGVRVFLLNDDEDGQGQRQELSAVDVPGENNPEASALALFEGYGETGQWHLEIDNIDLRLITDVLVSFGIHFPEPSDRLETLIERLVAEHEAGEDLDKVALVSLRGQFPDAFDALASGPATFVLEDTDFPPGITDLRVKAIVGQVVDDEGRGVAGITVRFNGVGAGAGYDETRTTGELGFTEVMEEPIPVVQPPEARVPAAATWEVHLVDPGQFDQIGDLRIFVVHSFRSVEEP
jgi:hypothetical protein